MRTRDPMRAVDGDQSRVHLPLADRSVTQSVGSAGKRVLHLERLFELLRLLDPGASCPVESPRPRWNSRRMSVAGLDVDGGLIREGQRVQVLIRGG